MTTSAKPMTEFHLRWSGNTWFIAQGEVFRSWVPYSKREAWKACCHIARDNDGIAIAHPKRERYMIDFIITDEGQILRPNPALAAIKPNPMKLAFSGLLLFSNALRCNGSAS